MKMRLFFGSMAVTLALFIACDAGSGEEILDGYTASHKPPPEGSYIISIFVTDVDGQGSAHASIENADKERFDDITTANAKDTVILTVIPPVITETDDSGEGENTVYYFVAPITGYYEGKDGTPKTYNAFKKSPNVSNEYTFTMPAGNVTVNVSFTDKVDETSAFLRWFGVSAGSYTVSPQDPFEYTVTVPYGSDEEFYIYAQAENQDATLELLQGNPGTGDDLSGQALTLTEGLNEYTINVTSQDGNTTKQYRIKVIKLPDLSLKTLQIKKGSDVVRDLPPSMNTQNVYVPYTDGIEVFADPADQAINDLGITPSGKLTADVPAPVTVTVSKPIPGVDSSLTTQDYILNLYYGPGAPPLAEGGYTSFIPGETPGSYYETHTFLAGGVALGAQAKYDLIFKDEKNRPSSVEVLVVAGGGGGGISGGASWHAGGGGAGGYIYISSYQINAASISVKVGAGGAKAASLGGVGKNASIGGNGGNSEFGGITANGGGGGASHSNSIYNDGKAGGSGGGATASAAGGAANPGKVVPDGVPAAVKLGNVGGSVNAGYSGGGGGGAGAAGGSPGNVSGKGALGGVGTISAISGTKQWYAGGGAGGAANYASSNPPLEAYGATAGNDGAAGTGDGGSGGGGISGKNAGGSGGGGIVIVRFPASGNEMPVQSAGGQ